MSKAEFVKKLGKFLSQINVDVEEIYLKNDETAVVRFTNGFEKQVNIACDGNNAIIIDVVKAIMY